MKDKPSPFANPCKIGRDGNCEEVLEKCEVLMRQRLPATPYLLCELEGKTLGCWCKPAACSHKTHVKTL